jgi:alpha-L-fucosidase
MLAAASGTLDAAEIGGGDKNPNLSSNQQAIEKWQDARFGLSVHWGPVALRGMEIGWARSDQIPKEEYDSLYKEFNPVLFNAK